MPDLPPSWLKGQTIFLDIFAGMARLTRFMANAGWTILPPIDINVDGDVLVAADVLDRRLWQKVIDWINSGVITLVHFGTPCTTLSRRSGLMSTSLGSQSSQPLTKPIYI